MNVQVNNTVVSFSILGFLNLKLKVSSTFLAYLLLFVAGLVNVALSGYVLSLCWNFLVPIYFTFLPVTIWWHWCVLIVFVRVAQAWLGKE